MPYQIQRKVLNDITVPPALARPRGADAYIVPKGHYILSSPAVSQMDPQIWRDAEKWDPLRWLDTDGVALQASYTYDSGEKFDYGFGPISKGTQSPYQPFGAGRHRCIGESYADLQIGTIIASFVRRMEFRIENKVPDRNYHVSYCVQVAIDY